MSRSCVVQNADCSVLTYATWQKAVTLVVMGEAIIIEEHPTKRIRSQYEDIPLPTVVQLMHYVYIPWNPAKAASKSLTVSKRGVLQRDKNTCAYCGKYADTVDHVIPRSRGGEDTWFNFVAACFSCNNKKDDKTPQEAGMKLRWEPYVPDVSRAQRKIWKVLAQDDDD